MTDTILVVDDENDVVDLLVHHIKKAGFQTLTATEGISALQKIERELPALVILDLMLPGLDGNEICKRMKANPKTSHIPILMLTAKAEEVDRILGLELGADDYVTKPFSPREIILRIKSILRRKNASNKPTEILKIGSVTLDRSQHEVTLNRTPITLTITEFKLLALLMERKGRVQSRDQLLNDVWGYEGDMDTRTVDTHVRRLREKMGVHADLIETIRGVGYRFCVE